MAENKNFEEEYQYVEEGEPSFEPSGVGPMVDEKMPEHENVINSLLHQPNVKRNALIVIVGLILFTTIIKCSTNKTSNINQKGVIQPVPQEQPKPVMQTQAPSMLSSDLNNLIAAQKTMQNSVVGISDQLAQLNIHLSSQDKNNDALQKMLEDIQAKENANAILLQEILMLIKMKPAAPKLHEVPKHVYEAPKLEYFVQAVIPGRAWLINEKGQAITIRIGSEVTGYGIVKEIDPQEGRVVMSSSKVFRFKHDD